MFMQQHNSATVFAPSQNFHFCSVEEGMSAKEKALSLCDLHMVPQQHKKLASFRNAVWTVNVV